MITEIAKAKIALYRLLIEKDPDEMTHNEADIGYLLSRDADIQACFNRAETRQREASEKQRKINENLPYNPQWML